MGEDRFSYGYKYRIDLYVASAVFLITMTTLLGISYLCESYPKFMPMVSIPIYTIFDIYDSSIQSFFYLTLSISQMEKQYPQKDKVHYTFEPSNS